MGLELSDATWRKSTYSDGQEDCLEVGVRWRKSTYSAAHEECLEVADSLPGHLIPVRDSKVPAGPTLLLPAGAWAAFVHAVSAAAGIQAACGTNET